MVTITIEAKHAVLEVETAETAAAMINEAAGARGPEEMSR